MYYFIVYVNSSKIALVPAPRFSGKAAAKVRTFLIIFQIFSKVFSIFLRKWSPARRRPLSENGCKGKDFFCYLPNFTESFFKLFFRRASRKPATRADRGNRRKNNTEVSHYQCISCSSIAASFPKAGAKVHPLHGMAKYISKFFGTFIEVFIIRAGIQRITKTDSGRIKRIRKIGTHYYIIYNTAKDCL